MKYIFLLSADCIDLAKEEILSLFHFEDFVLVNKLFIVDLKNNEREIVKLNKRLALTKSIYKLLLKCDFNDLIKTIKNFDWSSIYKDNFCLRAHYQKISLEEKFLTKYSEKEVSGYIWRSVEKPKVDLENPKTRIDLFFTNKNVYCGLLIFENNEDFESRKSHLRPFPHPSSLHPRLARALINITGIKEDEILFDPFCGTGGFLIEAGLMKIKTIGYDINKSMVNGCIKNLKNLKIQNFTIFPKNALKIFHGFDYVVSDLPYGLNSNIYLEYAETSLKHNKRNKINLKINKESQIKQIEKFYLKFLKRLRKILNKKAVIIFPNYVDYKSLLKTAKFKIENEFLIYVHRNLTREIVKIV